MEEGSLGKIWQETFQMEEQMHSPHVWKELAVFEGSKPSVDITADIKG